MRKQRHEEHVDSEKWAIPYADLMTLLLAFFVVMYSLSSLNEGKYRILAESITAAFKGTGKMIDSTVPPATPSPAPRPANSRSGGASPVSLIPVPVVPRDVPPPGHEGAAADPSAGDNPKAAQAGDTKQGGIDAEVANLKAISTEIAKALKPWVDTKQVIIRQTKFWLEIEIRTDVLFASGVANLTDAARGVLDGVAGVLGRFPNAVRIEGFTDDRPIDTFRFPSNWELSAARAGSVARLFSEHGVDPRRIGIFGWGEYHPVASNDTVEGRNRNRRIAIVVLSDQGAPVRYYNNDNLPMAADSSAPASAPTAPVAAVRQPAATGGAIGTPAAPPAALHRPR